MTLFISLFFVFWWMVVILYVLILSLDTCGLTDENGYAYTLGRAGIWRTQGGPLGVGAPDPGQARPTDRQTDSYLRVLSR